MGISSKAKGDTSPDGSNTATASGVSNAIASVGTTGLTVLFELRRQFLLLCPSDLHNPQRFGCRDGFSARSLEGYKVIKSNLFI